MGVTSLIDLISTPAACRARTDDSRPEPGPLTRMSSERRPESLAALAAAEAACWAAKGVPLREPLNCRVPALAQATTFPSRSVIVTWVLLKEAWICTMPCVTCFFSFLLFLPPPPAGFAATAICLSYSLYLLGAAALGRIRARRGPLRVRAFVCVRCP